MNSRHACLTPVLRQHVTPKLDWLLRADESPWKTVVATAGWFSRRDHQHAHPAIRNPSCSCTINRTHEAGEQVHGSSNRNREPRRTKLAARAAEWFWHAAGYIRFSTDATVTRGACADIIHACAGVRSPTHTKHTRMRSHTHTHVTHKTQTPLHMQPTARREVKSDEMENTHSKRTFHARRVFRLEEEETREGQKGHWRRLPMFGQGFQVTWNLPLQSFTVYFLFLSPSISRFFLKYITIFYVSILN